MVHHGPDSNGARQLIDGSGASITPSVTASLAGPASVHTDMEVVNCITLRYIGLAAMPDI